MMRNNDCKEIRSGVLKRLYMALFGLVVLVTSGCGSGGSGDGVIVAVLPFEGSLKLQADFMNTGQLTGGFVFNFGPQGARPPVAGQGADISTYQSLKFSIDASAVANFANLTIRLESPGVNTIEVNLADYVPSVSRTWNSYVIPLSNFPGVDLTDVIFLGFWDARDGLDVLVFGKLDFDDIHFVDAAGATLAVYSETSIDSVLFYNEIIYGDDPPLFNGNKTYAFDSVNGRTLPTDLVLNLACVNAGVFDPQSLQNPPDPANGDPSCILDDPENPFRTATIPEFDVNNPDAPTKFDILPPDGPDPCAVPPDPPANDPSYRPLGEKAEVYYWATALARRPSGENQYYTARALHRLWTVNTDPIVQDQAKRAYRSVLDYFFKDETFFSTRDFNTNCAEPEIFYPVLVRHEAGKLLYNTDPNDPTNTTLLDPERAHLYPGIDPALNGFRALEDMADWGHGFDTAKQEVF